MRSRFATVLVLALAVALVRSAHPESERLERAPSPVPAMRDSIVSPLSGVYASKEHPDQALTITPYGRGQAYITGHGWDALGWFGSSEFEGLWRRPGLGSDPRLPHEHGWLHLAVIRPGVIQARFDDSTGHTLHGDTWTFVNHFGPGNSPEGIGETPPAPRTAPGDPQPGPLEFVDELPEVLERIPPAYPADARRAGIEGTVVTQALVGTDGVVHDVRITKSIPSLDAAAIAAVRRWTFKPARSNGSPVEVWVAIPVKFSLRPER